MAVIQERWEIPWQQLIFITILKRARSLATQVLKLIAIRLTGVRAKSFVTRTHARNNLSAQITIVVRREAKIVY